MKREPHATKNAGPPPEVPAERTAEALHELARCSENVTRTIDDWGPGLVGDALGDDVSPNLQVNWLRIQSRMIDCDDLKHHEIMLSAPQNTQALVIFIESLVDRSIMEEQILHRLRPAPGQSPSSSHSGGQPLARDMLEQVRNQVTVSEVETESNIVKVLKQVLGGHTAIFVDGSDRALVCKTQGWKDRAVTTPQAETSILGPHNAFIENLQTNLGMIRRFVKDERLKVRFLDIGTRSQTKTALLYIDDIARDKVVSDMLERMGNISRDAITGPSSLVELIEGRRFNLFPLTLGTERPDVCLSFLLEGRVIVLVDGYSRAIGAPAVLMDFFKSPDDYYLPPAISGLLRIIRLIGVLLIVFLPGLYIAVTAYNPDLVTAALIKAFAQSRTGIPFTVLLEVAFMEIMMELLQEASVRLPSKIGPVATVFGGLVLGQAAAAAQIISNVMVIIVAITAISSFAIPTYEVALAWRVVKWVVVAGAAVFGLYGMVMAAFLIITYLNSLNSSGIPYLAPMSPTLGADLLEDSLVRAPQWVNRERPDMLTPTDKRRTR